jgi:ketosteroid isomerase-like protein
MSAPTVQEEIKQMYGEWFAAIADGDRGWFERTLDDGFIYGDICGGEKDKATTIVMDMAIRDPEIVLHELRVREYGDTAVVNAHYYGKVACEAEGVLQPELDALYREGVHMRFTAVWQRQADGWRALSHQATKADAP